MLSFLLVLSLLGAGWQGCTLIALVVAFSEPGKRKGLAYLALIALALFTLSRLLAPSYPDIELPSIMDGYAYRKTASSFDFYEAGTGRGPILVYYYNPRLAGEDMEGRRLRLSGLKLVRQQTRNRNGFNIEHYILSKGYLYGMRAKNINILDKKAAGLGEDALPRGLISSIRRYILAKSNYLSPRAREAYEALILGRLPRDSELSDISKASGLIHLFVVSGLHFSLIFGLLVTCFRFIFRSRKGLIYLFSIALSFIYFLVLGGGFGATRAFFSSLFLAHSEVKNRKYEPLKALAIVCLVHLLFLPWSVEQRGFQLSFLATFFIINLSRQGFIINIESPFLKQLFLSFCVNILLSFFLVLSASSSSLLSFVAISYSSFFLSVFLPLLFFFALLPSFLEPLFNLIAPIINILSDLLFDFLTLMKERRLPLSLHPSLAYALSALVLLSFLSYLLIYKRGGLSRSLSFLILSMGLILGPLMIRAELEFISYDLRDGEANLIKYGNIAIVYDVGNDRELISLLKMDGVHRIDHLIISHADQDHMGIVGDIYREFEVGEAYYDLSVKKREIGEISLSFDRLEGDYSRNDESLTMRLDYKTTSVYFTGDIQVDGMKHALKNSLKCEILKIPHHGSYTELNPYFIEACKPEFSIIAGGRGKRINKEPIHKYLITKGLSFYDTMLQGEMRLSYDGSGWDY